jgi:hypothetical protein
MNKKTSFTYSYNSDDISTSKIIEYNTSYTDSKNNILYTSYKNSITDDKIYESFNKLYINDNNKNEQVGISINKDDWNLKEFHNDNLLKEYKECYEKHPYNKIYLEDKFYNMGKNDIDNLKNIDDSLLEKNILKLTI